MAIRKSKEENLEVYGTINDWLSIIETALLKGNFTSIQTNALLNQVTANYKKLTVWGNIKITLTQDRNKIKLNIISTSNVDNIYALFKSPNDVILNKFKSNISATHPPASTIQENEKQKKSKFGNDNKLNTNTMMTGITSALVADKIFNPEESNLNQDNTTINVVAIDSNNDKIVDAVILDQNSDGVLDAILIDENSDGIIDTIAFDSNNDNIIDTIVLDYNYDGYADAFYYESGSIESDGYENLSDDSNIPEIFDF